MSTAFRRLVAASLGLLFALGGVPVAAPLPAAAQEDPFAASSETIYYWNDVLLEAFRRQGGAPGPLARTAAMMHAGMFDVFNSNWLAWGGIPGYDGYTGIVPLKEDIPGDGLEAGGAAAYLLRDALPEQAPFIEQAFHDRYGGDLPENPSFLGRGALAPPVVDSMRNLRAGDGSQDDTPYPFENVPGAWQLTGHGCDSPTGPTGPVTPNWGRVTPFVLSSGDQFRPPHPAGATSYPELLGSDLYATQHDEVRRLGRFDSTEERTEEQEEIAWFWANDLDGTYKPVGQALHHTRLVTEQLGVPDPAGTFEPVALARLFTLVSLALADAGIAAWDAKYDTTIDLWRPQTAIQRADEDGNGATVRDPDWEPLSADRPSVGAPRFNPCFPAWPSGHATFSAAWAAVMRAEYGNTPSEPLVLDSEDPRAAGVQRTYNSFTQIAEENAISRLYLGVHYRFDATSGTALGLDVGDHVQSTSLTEICHGCTTPAQAPAVGAGLVFIE